MSVSKEKRNPSQLPLFIPAEEPADDELPPNYVFDPERKINDLHTIQLRNHTSKLFEADIRHQVTQEMKALCKIFGIPTDAERMEMLRESFEDTIFFLRSVPFRDTNVMDFLMNNVVSADDLEELQAILAGQLQTFIDKDTSDGFQYHGNPTAMLFARATQPKPKHYRK